MKIISKEDLIILIPLIGDCNNFSLDDFELLLDRFGDDYFMVDGIFQKTDSSKEMLKIRKAFKQKERR